MLSVSSVYTFGNKIQATTRSLVTIGSCFQVEGRVMTNWTYQTDKDLEWRGYQQPQPVPAAVRSKLLGHLLTAQSNQRQHQGNCQGHGASVNKNGWSFLFHVLSGLQVHVGRGRAMPMAACGFLDNLVNALVYCLWMRMSMALSAQLVDCPFAVNAHGAL